MTHNTGPSGRSSPSDLDIPYEPDHYLAVSVTRPASHSAVILRVEGHLDHDTVPLLRQRIAPYVGHGTRVVVFDLSKLVLMTSPGVGALLQVRRAQEKTHGRCLFVNVPPRIRRVLDVMDAVPATDLFANVAEMDTYLLALQRGEIGINEEPPTA